MGQYGVYHGARSLSGAAFFIIHLFVSRIFIVHHIIIGLTFAAYHPHSRCRSITPQPAKEGSGGRLETDKTAVALRVRQDGARGRFCGSLSAVAAL